MEKQASSIYISGKNHDPHTGATFKFSDVGFVAPRLMGDMIRSLRGAVGSSPLNPSEGGKHIHFNPSATRSVPASIHG